MKHEVWRLSAADGTGASTGVLVDDDDLTKLGMVVQRDGGVVLAGYVEAAVDLGGGTLPHGGGKDLAAFRLDSAGDHVWSGAWGDEATQEIDDVAGDACGTYVITEGESGVDLGIGTPSGRFVVRLDPDGVPDMFAPFEGPAADRVASHGSGYWAMAGTGYMASDFGGDTGQVDGWYVVLYDNDGGLAWVHRFGGYVNSEVQAVAFDALGNVYVAGNTTTADEDFDPGCGAAGAGGDALFLASFDGATGAPRWSALYPMDADNLNTMMAVASDGTVVLAGFMEHDLDLGGSVGTLTGANPTGRAPFMAAFAQP